MKKRLMITFEVEIEIEDGIKSEKYFLEEGKRKDVLFEDNRDLWERDAKCTKELIDVLLNEKEYIENFFLRNGLYAIEKYLDETIRKTDDTVYELECNLLSKTSEEARALFVEDIESGIYYDYTAFKDQAVKEKLVNTFLTYEDVKENQFITRNVFENMFD